MRYSAERKDAVLKKMVPPHNHQVAVLAEGEGILDATLYLWRTQAWAHMATIVGCRAWAWDVDGTDKFAVVAETIGLSEVDRAEYGKKRACISIRHGRTSDASRSLSESWPARRKLLPRRLLC